ncbi:JAB domain-containing protein [Mycoplasma sp. ATU-Cv-508]|uniref:JAB domain-containing protein n=1 Tax=Mycoplasma sp. ATU-Cv-508 TaxID=2048001 RepID=UPI0013753385
MLDQKNVVLYWETIYKGTNSFVSIEPAKIIGTFSLFKRAVFTASITIRQEKTNPSPADRMITSKIVQCAKIFGIQLLGHIVVCADGSYEKICNGSYER